MVTASAVTGLLSVAATAVTPAASSAAGDIDGMFDVGGHSLYLSCSGTGSPTVVYLHGAVWETDYLPHANGLEIQDLLDEDLRVCVYDRRNVGYSDVVNHRQTSQDAVRDMRQLLAAAGVEPPYLLLGASFGGLLAYLYANHHPDEVAGMVLLDSMFPDELSLEQYLPEDMKYKTFHKEDQCCSPERISHWKFMKDAQHHVGREPALPVSYLASAREPWNSLGVAEYDDQVIGLLESYVSRFSPGTLTWVEANHFMEPEIPDRIADTVRQVASSGAAG
jgi:pimeloyl-ACP methyl ester carboxylesterase